MNRRQFNITAIFGGLFTFFVPKKVKSIESCPLGLFHLRFDDDGQATNLEDLVKRNKWIAEPPSHWSYIYATVWMSRREAILARFCSTVYAKALFYGEMFVKISKATHTDGRNSYALQIYPIPASTWEDLHFGGYDIRRPNIRVEGGLPGWTPTAAYRASQVLEDAK